MRREHLDGDRAVEPHIAREIDDAHPAAPELTLERELPLEGLAESLKVAAGRQCHAHIIDGTSRECPLLRAVR